MCVTEHQAAMVLMRKDYNQQVDKLQVMFIVISGVLFLCSFVCCLFFGFVVVVAVAVFDFFVSFFVIVFSLPVSSILSFRFLFLLFFPFNFISFLINPVTLSVSFFVSCLLSVCLFWPPFGVFAPYFDDTKIIAPETQIW